MYHLRFTVWLLVMLMFGLNMGFFGFLIGYLLGGIIFPKSYR